MCQHQCARDWVRAHNLATSNLQGKLLRGGNDLNADVTNFCSAMAWTVNVSMDIYSSVYLYGCGLAPSCFFLSKLL